MSGLSRRRMSEVVRLRDLAERGSLLINDGYRTRADELGEPGIPILRVAEVQQGYLTPTFGDHVRESFRARIASKVSRPGDVVVTTKGTVGRVAQMPRNSPEFVYSPQVCFFRCLDDTIDSRWLYYWFRGPEFQRQATGVQSQTDMAAYINLADMRSMRLTLPTIATQRRAAGTLGALDAKIDANRRQSSLIDEFLRAQFAALVLQAPTISLAELATFVKGVSYRSADLLPSETSLVTLKSIGRRGGYEARGLKPYIGSAKPGQVLHPGDLVVAQTDLTQAAEVMGRVARIPADESSGRLVASLDLVIVRPRSERMPGPFLYGLLLDERFRQHCRSRASGTTVLHLATDALPQYRAPSVSPERQHAYADIGGPLLDKQDALRRESTRLATLREALLPELLSGRLRVAELRNPVEALVV